MINNMINNLNIIIMINNKTNTKNNATNYTLHNKTEQHTHVRQRSTKFL